MASLLRKSMFDMDWPSWTTLRSPFDRNDGLLDMMSDTVIRVEEFELDKNFVIRAEVPGIDPDKDVELTVADGALRLKVHRARQSHNGDRNHFRSEFEYGALQRFILLPATATETDVKATYKDGILEVRLPMNGATAREHRVAIARG